MSSLKHYILLSLFFFLSINAHSQKKSKTQLRKEAQKESAEKASHLPVLADSLAAGYIDYGAFKLPPLSVLYENARSNPSITILEKEKQLQEKLLTKEKKSWLSYFNAHGNYSYGIADNYGTSSDAATPMVFYQYTGMKQSFWNVGGGVNLPIDDIFDYKNKVKRQKIAIDKAQLTKEQTFDQLKQQIIHLYVSIQSNIEAIKYSSQHAALLKGVYLNVEEEYKKQRSTLEAVASAKSAENEAVLAYETLKATINEQILVLEILSRTEILHQ